MSRLSKGTEPLMYMVQDTEPHIHGPNGLDTLEEKYVWRPHINVTHSTGQSPNLLKRKKEETEPAITCAARTCQKIIIPTN
jgi:hypothetical protein